MGSLIWQCARWGSIAALVGGVLLAASYAQTPSERCMAAQKRVQAANAEASREAATALRYVATTDTRMWLEPIDSRWGIVFADTTANVQVAGSGDKPGPWSGPPFVCVALREPADISIDILHSDDTLLASLDFVSVPAGIYRTATDEIYPRQVIECSAQLRVGERKIGTPRHVLWWRP
jgi:hypothetical protein